MARLRPKDVVAALDDAHLSAHLPNIRDPDPEVVFAEAWEHVRLMGFRILPRERGPVTTLYGAMFLPPAFYSAPYHRRAPWVRHELIHAWEWREVGRLRFAGRYITPRGRWIIEMHSFRETMRTLQEIGANNRALTYEAGRRAGSMSKSYKLRALDQAQVFAETRAVMLESVGLL